VTNRKLTLILVTFLSFLVCSTAWSSADPKLFPRPKGLEPAVQFWTKVFTEVNTKEGYIHDDSYLDVICEKFKFDPKLTRRQNQKRLKREKEKIVKILRSLSRGKRSGLSSEEKRILALWPEDVSNSTLRGATDRVRFQLGQKDKFKAGLIRSGRWRDYILDNLKKKGLPREILALPHVESSFNPKAYSPAGAAGLWQFTRSTGRRFMRIDHIVDERMDPFKATIAAGELLQNNYDIIGTWPLATTAYNHGAAGMRHAARKMGTTDIGYIIKHYKSRSFKFASRNYYPALLSAVDIEDDYKKYFGDVQLDPPIKDEILKVPGYVSINSIAKALGISKSELKERNLALRPAVWSNNKLVPKGYEIRVRPGASKYSPNQALARLQSEHIYAKQKPDSYHRVRRGQTLSTIAARYHVSVKAIARLNNIRRQNRIRVGQVLRLPQRGGRFIQVASNDDDDELITTRKSTRKNSKRSSKSATYKVRRGDSIARIARKFRISQRQLVAWNGLNRRKPIYPGQHLKVRSTPVEEAVVVAKAEKIEEPQAKAIQVAAVESKDSSDAQDNADNVDNAEIADNDSNKSETDDAAAPDNAASSDTSDNDAVANSDEADNSTEDANNDADSQPSEISDAADTTKTDSKSDNHAYVDMISEYLDNSGDKSNESIEAHLPAIDAPGSDNSASEEEKPTDAEPNVPAIAEEIEQPVVLEPPVDAKQTQEQLAQVKKNEEVFPTNENPDLSTDTVASSDEEKDQNAAVSIEDSTEAIEEESSISADPTDYTVANNKTIEVQASETLGHYAEWLGVRASRLRHLNRMRYRTPLVIGKRLKLDFRHISPEEFVKLRVAYHRSMQEAYFEQFEITGSERHRVRRGESLWKLAKRKYKIPVWLFRQYNPDLAFNKFKAGITVTFPSVKPRDDSSVDDNQKNAGGEHNKMAVEPQSRSRKRQNNNKVAVN